MNRGWRARKGHRTALFFIANLEICTSALLLWQVVQIFKDNFS